MGDNDLGLELDDIPADVRAARLAADEAKNGSTSAGIELDVCRRCSRRVPLDENGFCEPCFNAASPTKVGADFNDIADESRRNANAPNLGEHARGRATLGVGFTSSEGYLEALRRGVARATLDEYVSILKRDGYAITQSVHASLYRLSVTKGNETEVIEAPLLIVQAAAGYDAGVDSKVNDEAIANIKRKGAAQRAAQQQAKQQSPSTPLQSAPVEVDAQPVRIQHGQLVAGAAAEGHGIEIGWEGSKEKTHAELKQRMQNANIPDDWMIEAKEPKVQLGRAVKEAAGSAYDCKQEKKKDAQVVEERDWAARWLLVSNVTSGAKVGDKLGDIALVVTLYTDKPEPELVFDEESNAELRDEVKKQFESRIAAQLYTAADITAWLKTLIKKQLGGVKLGRNWYVPRKHRATAERLVAALDKWWGEDWVNPPLPIATSAQLAQGLANGLQREVDDELRKLETERDYAQKNGRSDIGAKRAESFLLQLRRIAERVAQYQALIGEELVASCKEKVRIAQAELSSVIEGADSVERFASMWEEVLFDIERKGEVLQ